MEHHSAKFTCRRCFKLFKTEADLGAHAIADKQCKVADRGKGYIIDEATWKEVLAAHKAAGSATTGEKWRIMFRILFPGDGFIPNPCLSSYQI